MRKSHTPTRSRNGHQATQRPTKGLGPSTPRHQMPGPIRTITPGPDTHPHHTERPRGPGRLPPNGEDTHGNTSCAPTEGPKLRSRPRPPNGPHPTEEEAETIHCSPAHARTATPPAILTRQAPTPGTHRPPPNHHGGRRPRQGLHHPRGTIRLTGTDNIPMEHTGDGHDWGP